MPKKIKLSLLLVAKWTSLFWLCRWLYRSRLRILCYHGFAFADEHLFRPKLFMTASTFKQRLDWLQHSGYQVVSLEHALAQPAANQLVLTMDDGWSGTYQLIYPTLKQYQFPLMLYVTSYYADKQIPVLNVALSYLLWKTTEPRLELLIPELAVADSWVLAEHPAAQIVSAVCQKIDLLEQPEQRATVLTAIAAQLKVPLEKDGQHLFRLLNQTELRQLQQVNVDLQLHTHRHCSPLQTELFQRELDDNRNWLAQFQPEEKLQHFCYPSGEYDPQHLPWLSAHQVKTATTTQIGLYQQGTDLLQMPRILDGEDVHLLELEAELSGFMTLMRRLLKGYT